MRNQGFNPDWMSPPGDSIDPVLVASDSDQAYLSASLGVSKAYLKNLLEGSEEIDARLAERLAQQAGGTSRFWVQREESFRARLSSLIDTGNERACKLWLKQFPIAEMKTRGWLRSASSPREQINLCLKFFDVATVEELRETYFSRNHRIAFRASPTFNSRLGSVSSWLKQAEHESTAYPLASFSRKELRGILDELRSLSFYKEPSQFIPKIKDLLSRAGVAFVILSPPPGCALSGAAFLRTDGHPVIAQSFRFRTDDHFWFTLFHEVAHVILHELRDGFFEGLDCRSEKEDEANEFAENAIIPSELEHQFRTCHRSKYSLVRFARSIGIAPGIIVGQLQHHGLIARSNFNYLKVRYPHSEF